MEMTPAQLHIHLQVLSRAGMLPMMTVAAPGTHGEEVAGMQGMGVSTPSAADVAAATVGFASDMHIPNVGMFTMGLWSMMLAAGGPPHIVLLVGRTTSELGAAPKLHIKTAPATTC